MGNWIEGIRADLVLSTARIALLAGALLWLASMMVTHPLIHFGGVVHYPWQAISIAKRSYCGQYVGQFNLSLPWRAELTEDTWVAGFAEGYGGASFTVDAQTGRVTECRTWAE